VAILGTLLDSTYVHRIDAVAWPAPLPPQLLEAIRGSIQGAHIAAANVPNPALGKLIVDNANQAFTSGMTHALLTAAIIMAATAVFSLVVVPTRVRPYRDAPPGPG
jgi:hypothetical protein